MVRTVTAVSPQHVAGLVVAAARRLFHAALDEALHATAAMAAEIRGAAHHVVAGLEARDALAHPLHHAGGLVAEDDG